jgi:7-cyano-7-deazaguanine synthase
MNDLAIAYSGGLDSLISYHYAIVKGYTPICFNINFGHEYNDKEVKSMAAIRKKYSPDKIHRVDLSSIMPLMATRLTNQIIPSRNVLLAVVGSMIAPRVWINALDGEQNGKEHDKSPKFFEDTSKLLTFTNEIFQPKTIVESPFANMTKSQIIKWALENGIPEKVLTETSSCYDANQQKCGKCLTCVKRYLAFKANGIIEHGYTTNPLESDYYKELEIEIPKAMFNQDFSRFTRSRIEEFMGIGQFTND